MDLNNDCGDVIPFYESIDISPSIAGDQGDTFQCGKCKQFFYNIIDFFSHKREHSEEQRICHVVNGYPANIITLSQANNEIWLWREQSNTEVKDGQESFLTPINTDIHEIVDQQLFQSNFIDETTRNFKCLEDNTTPVISDKETDESINSLSCFSCFTCGGCFETDVQLTDHVQIHLPLEAQEFPTNSVVEKSSKVKGDKNKISQCIICGRIFANKSALKKHVLSHKVWSDGLSKTLPSIPCDSDTNYECPYCHQTFKTHLNLRSHLKEHKHQKVFKCIQGECGEMYVDLNSLISHINVDHEDTEYHCHICDTVLPTLEEIANHQQMHSQNDDTTKNIFKCDYCKAVFKRHYHLKHHLDTANHKHKCSYCGKCYTSERSLRKHLLQHDESKSYKCTTCKATFKLKQYLMSHLVTHSKEKYFSCNVCLKEFKRKDLLVRHMKLHQPDQRKQCPYRHDLNCMADFTRTDKLNKHIKTHLDKLDIISDKSVKVILVPG